MPSPQNGERSNPSEAQRRLMSIHGAASAAVVAVNRLSSILPLTQTSNGEELEAASKRLAESIRRLEGSVTRVMQTNVETAGKLLTRVEQQESSEKWQKRYHAIERERDSLQAMLVALKDRYEKLQASYHQRQHAYDLKVLEHEALQLRHLEARQRLDQSLAVLGSLIASSEDVSS